MSYSDAWRGIDFRKHPEKYLIGRGEQGVLLAEPYKSEILPHWRFKTPEIAEHSARIIYALFKLYLSFDDFVGADMARKYLQMGWTRSRRYANHKTGKKYCEVKGQRVVAPFDMDLVKAESADRFFKFYNLARTDVKYLKMKAQWNVRQFE